MARAFFSRKGTELPINVLVTLVFLVIVLVAIVLFVQRQFESGSENIGQMKDRTLLCKAYSEARCVISDVSLVRNPNLANDLETVCKKEGIIAQDTVCSPFDTECGRKCCPEMCGMFS